MNALVVYYSKFGNTKRVAHAIAEASQSAGSVRLMSADELSASDIDNVDLLVVGTPTHKAKLPEELRPILTALPKRVLEGVRVAAFDTSYKMNWFLSLFTAARPLNRKLRQLGGKQIVPPKSFFVVEKQGPLYEGEIARAKTWAESILEKYRRSSQQQGRRQ